MDPFTSAAAAMLPSLAGGAMDFLMGKDAESDARRFAKKMDKKARVRFKDDRSFDIQLADRKLAEDRAYYAKMLGDDRRYAEGRTAADRAYLAAEEARDRVAWGAEQDRIVRESAQFAEKSAASRGVNFAKLRDDAIAAGFNPLTAMSLAQMYSTEVNYESPRQAFGASSAYLGGPSNVAAGGAGPMSSPMSFAGMSSTGGGYSSAGAPTLSSGSFLAQAFDNGLQTFFNAKEDAGSDWLEAGTAQKSAAVESAREILRQTPRDFGYNLSKVAPFRPAVTVSGPVFNTGRERAPVDPGALQEMQRGSETSLPVFKTVIGDVPVSGRYDSADDLAQQGGEFGDLLGSLGMMADYYDSTWLGKSLNRFERPARYAPPARKSPRSASARPYAKPSKNYANR